MSISEPAAPDRIFVIDKALREVDRTRMLLRTGALLLAAVVVTMAIYAVNARSLGHYRLFNQLLALSPFPLFLGIEVCLASRKSARDRIVSLELSDDRVIAHSLYSPDWQASYRDITDILVRYRRRYPHYDHMSLLLTLRNGEILRMGHCQGETLDAAAAALRERCREISGGMIGTTGKDRTFRVRQRLCSARSAALFFMLCSLGLAVGMLRIEREYAVTRHLEREGVAVEARMTTQFPRKDHVLVFYLFQTPYGDFEKGDTRLPIDPSRKLRQGSTITVLYSPDDPSVHRGAGAFPKHSALRRWLGWIGVLVLLAIAVICWLGWDALVFRGKLRILGRDELAEDSLTPIRQSSRRDASLQ